MCILFVNRAVIGNQSDSSIPQEGVAMQGRQVQSCDIMFAPILDSLKNLVRTKTLMDFTNETS